MKEREEALVRGSGLIPLLVGGLLGCVLVICIVVVILVVWRHRRSKSDGMSVAMYACIYANLMVHTAWFTTRFSILIHVFTSILGSIQG